MPGTTAGGQVAGSEGNGSSATMQPLPSSNPEAGNEGERPAQTRVKKFLANYGWLTGSVISCLETKGQDTGEASSFDPRNPSSIKYQVRFDNGIIEDIPLYALDELITLATVAQESHIVLYSYETDRHFHAKVRDIDDSKTNNIRAEFETTRADWIDLRRFKFQLLHPKKPKYILPPTPGEEIEPVLKKEVAEQSTQTTATNTQHCGSQTDAEPKAHQQTQTEAEEKADVEIQTDSKAKVETTSVETQTEPEPVKTNADTQTDPEPTKTDHGTQTAAVPQTNQEIQTEPYPMTNQQTQTDADEKVDQEVQTAAEAKTTQETQTEPEEKIDQEIQTEPEPKANQETQTDIEEKLHQETQTDMQENIDQGTQTEVEEETVAKETHSQTTQTDAEEKQEQGTQTKALEQKNHSTQTDAGKMLHQQVQTEAEQKQNQETQTTSVEMKDEEIQTLTEATVPSMAVAAPPASSKPNAANEAKSPEQRRLSRQLEIDMVGGGFEQIGDHPEENAADNVSSSAAAFAAASTNENGGGGKKRKKRDESDSEASVADERANHKKHPSHKTLDESKPITLSSPPLSEVRKNTRLAILYDIDEEYYSVKVINVRRAKSRTMFEIEYDFDSYREWTILTNREFYLLDDFLEYEEHLKSIKCGWIPAENIKKIKREEEEGEIFGEQTHEFVRDPFTRVELPTDAERSTDLQAARRRTIKATSVGSRVAVWSTSEKQFYKGVIKDFKEKKGVKQHQVAFDNGGKSWVSLDSQVFYLLFPPEKHSDESDNEKKPAAGEDNGDAESVESPQEETTQTTKQRHSTNDAETNQNAKEASKAKRRRKTTS